MHWRVRQAERDNPKIVDWLDDPRRPLTARNVVLDDDWLRLAVTQANDGIHTYDDILFKIRSWWMALASLILVGILGFKGNVLLKVELAQVFFGLTCIGISFWLMDALNKSLQTVQIHLARDLEEAQPFNVPVYSITKARRYALRSGRHARAMLQQISEESVALFYLLPILGFGAVLGAYDFVSKRNAISADTLDFLNEINPWTLGSLLMLAFLTIGSKLVSHLNFLVILLKSLSQRAQKQYLISMVEAHAPGYLFARVRGFQFHIVGRKVVFFDYSKTWSNPSFVTERKMVAEGLGYDPIYVDVGRDLVKYDHSGFQPLVRADLIDALGGDGRKYLDERRSHKRSRLIKIPLFLAALAFTAITTIYFDTQVWSEEFMMAMFAVLGGTFTLAASRTPLLRLLAVLTPFAGLLELAKTWLAEDIRPEIAHILWMTAGSLVGIAVVRLGRRIAKTLNEKRSTAEGAAAQDADGTTGD